MNKYLIIAIIIAALIIAAFAGSYIFALGMFLFRVMLGLIGIIVFVLGIIIGRFFPYKSKKQILND